MIYVYPNTISSTLKSQRYTYITNEEIENKN
jgi:hypothetical protein